MMDDVAKDMVELLAVSRDNQDVVQDINDVLFRWSMECEYHLPKTITQFRFAIVQALQF